MTKQRLSKLTVNDAMDILCLASVQRCSVGDR